jgi:hypothetical protein
MESRGAGEVYEELLRCKDEKYLGLGIDKPGKGV